MTSAERHEARYQRRKKKREEKRRMKSEQCGNYDTVFSFENLYKSGKKCIRGVRWKASIQNYSRKPFSNTYALYKSLKERKFEFTHPFIFWINERGKERKIQAQKITERVVQRTLCDKVIVPLYDKSLIYDNAANRIGKGIDHTLNRVNCHMQRHFRKYGLNGWIVTCDFADFFNSVPHDEMYKENAKRIFDKDIRNLANKCMEVYGNKGFGLGAHTSQIYTSVSVNSLDHYIKDKLRVKCYGRYVDDFYFFAETKEQAKELLEKIRNKINELGLKLNEKKTRIQKFENGFKFLKTKFFCTNSGKIIRKVNRKSAVRMRKKIRKFKNWIEQGRFTKEQAYNAYYSWKGHMQRGNSYAIIKKIDAYIEEIIP